MWTELCRYAYSIEHIQCRSELYALAIDTHTAHYAYNSFEHIDRNIVMRSFEIDNYWTLLLPVREVVFYVFLSTGWCVLFSQNVISCL